MVTGISGPGDAVGSVVPLFAIGDFLGGLAVMLAIVVVAGVTLQQLKPELLAQYLGVGADPELVNAVYDAAIDERAEEPPATADEQLERLLERFKSDEVDIQPDEPAQSAAQSERSRSERRERSKQRADSHVSSRGVGGKPDGEPGQATEPDIAAAFDATAAEIESALEIRSHLEETVQAVQDNRSAGNRRGDNEIIDGLAEIEHRPEAARETLTTAAGKLDEYHGTREALRAGDPGRFDEASTAEIRPGDLERIESQLRTVGARDELSADVRTVVGRFRDCAAARRSQKQDLERLERELEEAKAELESTTGTLSRAKELAGRIDRQVEADRRAGRHADWTAAIEYVADELESGRFGPRKASAAAASVRAETSPSQTADEMLERLANAESHEQAAIEAVLESVVTDVKRYDSIVKGGAKSIDAGTVKRTADRLQENVSDVDLPGFESVVSEYVESRKADVDRLGDDNVMTRYAIYQELIGLEDLLNRLASVESPEPPGELQAIASEVESEISSLAQRRRDQSRFGRANIFVEHYIDLAEEFHASGTDAMHAGDGKAARVWFEAARRIVEYTHEMYEGDKKRLLARAAGIAE